MRVCCVVALWFLMVQNVAAQDFDCEHDPLLDRSARRLIDDADYRGVQMRADLQAWGSDVVSFVADVGVHVDSNAVADLVNEVHVLHGSQVRCGIAESRGRYAVIATPKLGRLVIDTRGASMHVTATWETRFDAPRLYARYRDDSVRVIALNGEHDARLLLPRAADVSSVQLMGDGVEGPHVLAARYMDVPNNRHFHTENAALWLRGLRSKSHSVKRLRLLDKVASEHADAMCRYGKATHDVGEGRLATRLRRRGFFVEHTGEVVSRAESFSDALNSLAQSPAHYMTLIDKRFTKWGVGMSRDADGVECVVLALAQPKPHLRDRMVRR